MISIYVQEKVVLWLRETIHQKRPFEMHCFQPVSKSFLNTLPAVYRYTEREHASDNKSKRKSKNPFLRAKEL